MKYDDNVALEFLATSVSVQSRDAYVAWVTAWRIHYKALQNAIRDAKSARKPFRYAYRKPGEGTDGVPKRIQIGLNPAYSQSAAYYRRHWRDLAHAMMNTRAELKAVGIARKKSQFETAA